MCMAKYGSCKKVSDLMVGAVGYHLDLLQKVLKKSSGERAVFAYLFRLNFSTFEHIPLPNAP